jgi:hypothetical protein
VGGTLEAYVAQNSEPVDTDFVVPVFDVAWASFLEGGQVVVYRANVSRVHTRLVKSLGMWESDEYPAVAVTANFTHKVRENAYELNNDPQDDGHQIFWLSYQVFDEEALRQQANRWFLPVRSRIFQCLYQQVSKAFECIKHVVLLAEPPSRSSAAGGREK